MLDFNRRRFRCLNPVRITAMSLLLGAASPLHAASFDCEKAAAPDEKAVCSDRALNDLDVQMADFFEVNLSFQLMGGRGETRDEQREWLEKRRKCGGDKSCLLNAYRQRVGQLREGVQAIAHQSLFPDKK